MIRKLALATFFSVVAVVALSACSSAKPATQPDAPTASDPSASSGASHSGTHGGTHRSPPVPHADVVTRLIEDALQSDGSVSYRQLVRRLGAPRRVDAEPIANTYDPRQVDTLRTLHYSGVEALVYDVAFEPKSFLVRFSLLTDRYVTPEGLRVGDATDRVLDRIGPPTNRTQGGEWIYQESDSTPTAMIVTVDDGRVQRIDWEFYFS